jgi:site-specific recombinase XerD
MKGCRPLTETEVELVQQSFGGIYAARDRALFLLEVKTGFRISELLALRLGDVSQHGHIVDAITVARRYMKRKSEGRTVVVHADAQVALHVWITQLRQMISVTPQTFVFQSRKGTNQPISKVQAWKILHEAVVTNELTGTLGTHMMRKTFANRLYERLGHDLFKTQKALGHHNVNSTVQYLHVDQEEINAAIRAS